MPNYITRKISVDGEPVEVFRLKCLEGTKTLTKEYIYEGYKNQIDTWAGIWPIKPPIPIWCILANDNGSTIRVAFRRMKKVNRLPTRLLKVRETFENFSKICLCSSSPLDDEKLKEYERNGHVPFFYNRCDYHRRNTRERRIKIDRPMCKKSICPRLAKT
jgi:hypothetical protein